MPRAADCVCSKVPEDERNTWEYTDNKGNINDKNKQKMTGETPEICSDNRKPKMAAMATMAAIAAMTAMVAAMVAAICIQISKRKSMYIGRNAQDLKKWVRISTSTLTL